MSSGSAKAVLRERMMGALAPYAERAYRERPRVRVISLHDITPGVDSPFPGKMRWLARRYRVVSLASAHRREGLDPSRLNVALTFDDAYAEHATFAAPVLRELGLPATFFVPSGAVDLSGEQARRFAENGLRRTSRQFRFMSSEDVAALGADPLFEIGGHTRHHVDLGAANGRDLLADEIAGDKARLEELTRTPLRWFAYPFGGAEHTSRAAAQAIEAAGYDAAFTIMPGYWSRGQERYRVGRDSLAVDLPDRSWESSLRGGYDAVARLKYQRETRRAGKRDVRGRAPA